MISFNYFSTTTGTSSEIALHDCSWRVGKDWDMVGLQIEQSADASQPDVVRQHEIALKPTSLKGQVRWKVRHNAYNTLAVEHPSTDKLINRVVIAILVLGLITIVGILVAERCSR
jgi:hypothetical protein